MADPHSDRHDGISLAERLRAGKRERITMLSDAVFAIAATLAASEVGRDMAHLGQALAGYAVSFFVIAVFWWGHRDLRIRLLEVDAPLAIIILALLSAVAVIPAAARTLYASPAAGTSRFYAATMVVAGLLNMAQWLYVALNRRLLDPEVTAAYPWVRTCTTAVLPAAFVAMLAFPERVPPIAAPIAVLIVVAIRRTVQLVRE